MGSRLNIAVLAAVIACFGAAACRGQDVRREDVMAARGKGEAGIPVLSRALDSGDLVARRLAARMLSEIGAPASDILIEALSNTDDQVRRMAVEGLCGMGKLQVEHLLKAAADDSAPVREAAAARLNVLEMWDFLPDFEDAELPAAVLSGETKLVEGPHGIALKIPYSPFTMENGKVTARAEEQGMGAPNDSRFFPDGAFSIELWMSPDNDLYNRLAEVPYHSAFLADTMAVHVQHSDPDVECRHGYTVRLNRADSDSARIMVRLGFGREEALAGYVSQTIKFEPGEWYHVVFTYDGEGTGRIYVDGRLTGQRTHENKRGILAGRRDLHIGERGTGMYRGFPGKIGPVRLHHRIIEVD